VYTKQLKIKNQLCIIRHYYFVYNGIDCQPRSRDTNIEYITALMILRWSEISK